MKIVQHRAFFVSNVYLPIRKLIDDLIAPKERQRIVRSQIERGGAQFNLRDRSHIKIDPETDPEESHRDNKNRKTDPRHPHPISAQATSSLSEDNFPKTSK